ncbi:MAG TPA: hypothetical protein VNC84_06955 [Gammaproteobacteria bacterium]|jgi:hypothetical protein|nr:hypothetical protein [Gammaproteobacteria bacterium]
MLKKTIISACFMLLSAACLAEHCPSVQELQSPTFKGWQAYDSDDGALLSDAHTAQFKASAKAFALAEWETTGPKKGNIHCYYRDDNGSNLEAYFAKPHFMPANAQKMWYEVSGAMQCAVGADKCEFNVIHGTQKSQFAKR